MSSFEDNHPNKASSYMFCFSCSPE